VRLSAVYVGFFLAIGLPISAVTFSPSQEPLQCFVAASVGSLFITTILVFRLYIGWSHVGNRLLSATVEYEETGWYDGQVSIRMLHYLEQQAEHHTVVPLHLCDATVDKVDILVPTCEQKACCGCIIKQQLLALLVL
jgi:hypothetical protein